MSTVNLWSGAITDTSAVVSMQIDGGSARLLVADNAAMSGGVFYDAVATADVTFKATATGLAPDTQYWYQVEDQGVLDTSITGKFHTCGVTGEPYSYTFATASCAGHKTSYPAPSGLAPHRVSNHPVFDSIRAAAPLFFADMGDIHYYDAGSGVHVPDASVLTYHDGIRAVLATPRQGALFRDVPVAYVWDDHDFGPNNSDGTFAFKGNAAQAYRERVPHYPLPEATGSIYQSFQVGRVLHVMLDSRYNRDAPDAPAPRTYLGAAQLAWLDNLLASPPAGVEFLIVFTPQPFMSGGSTSWGSYTEERDQIYQMIGDHDWIGRMIALAGDQHQFGWDSGSHTAGFPLYVCSPLDSAPGVAGTAYDLGTHAARGQYGTVEVFDTGRYIQVTTRGWLG